MTNSVSVKMCTAELQHYSSALDFQNVQPRRTPIYYYCALELQKLTHSEYHNATKYTWLVLTKLSSGRGEGGGYWYGWTTKSTNIDPREQGWFHGTSYLMMPQKCSKTEARVTAAVARQSPLPCSKTPRGSQVYSLIIAALNRQCWQTFRSELPWTWHKTANNEQKLYMVYSS